MRTPPTRDEALAIWTMLADAGYTVTITSVTHEDMLPQQVFPMSVGPRRLQFTLDELNEVKALLPEGFTLSAPWSNTEGNWQIVLVQDTRAL